MAPGGLVGGDYGSVSYAQLVLGVDVGTVVMEGKVFINVPNSGDSLNA